MRVTGDEALLKALKVFPGKLSGQVLRRAGQKAGTVVAKVARQLVRPVSKTIAKSIGTKVKVYKSGKLLVLVGPKAQNPKSTKIVENPLTGVKKKRAHEPDRTAHLVDRGTKAHAITLYKKKKFRVVKHPGTKGNFYMERALIQQDSMAKQIYFNELKNGVAKLAAQLNTDK